jgi:hypothetical protein
MNQASSSRFHENMTSHITLMITMSLSFMVVSNLHVKQKISKNFMLSRISQRTSCKVEDLKEPDVINIHSCDKTDMYVRLESALPEISTYESERPASPATHVWANLKQTGQRMFEVHGSTPGQWKLKTLAWINSSCISVFKLSYPLFVLQNSIIIARDSQLKNLIFIECILLRNYKLFLLLYRLTQHYECRPFN